MADSRPWIAGSLFTDGDYQDSAYRSDARHGAYRLHWHSIGDSPSGMRTMYPGRRPMVDIWERISLAAYNEIHDLAVQERL